MDPTKKESDPPDQTPDPEPASEPSLAAPPQWAVALDKKFDKLDNRLKTLEDDLFGDPEKQPTQEAPTAPPQPAPPEEQPKVDPPKVEAEDQPKPAAQPKPKRKGLNSLKRRK